MNLPPGAVAAVRLGAALTNLRQVTTALQACYGTRLVTTAHGDWLIFYRP